MSVQGEVAGEFSTEIAAYLNDQFSRFARQLRHFKLPRGMTPERLSVLGVVEKQGSVSITALANNEIVQPATMSRLVSALVDQGLVKRGVDQDDGRGVLVRATRKGRRAYRHVQRRRLQHLAEVLEALSPEQFDAIRILTVALATLTTILEQPKSDIRRAA